MLDEITILNKKKRFCSIHPTWRQLGNMHAKNSLEVVRLLTRSTKTYVTLHDYVHQVHDMENN